MYCGQWFYKYLVHTWNGGEAGREKRGIPPPNVIMASMLEIHTSLAVRPLWIRGLKEDREAKGNHQISNCGSDRM